MRAALALLALTPASGLLVGHPLPPCCTARRITRHVAIAGEPPLSDAKDQPTLDLWEESRATELFERFSQLSPQTKQALGSCVDEVVSNTNSDYQPRVKWWKAWKRVHKGNHLEPFFRAWLTYTPVPGGYSALATPSTEHPNGQPDSPGYFIEKWDWLVNTEIGLSLNGFDEEWRVWFVDFLNVHDAFLKTTASWPTAAQAAWTQYHPPEKPHPFNISDFLQPPGGFSTFNEFFLRWIKDFPANRPLGGTANDPLSIVAPADGGIFSLTSSTSATDRLALPNKGSDDFNVVEAFPGYGDKLVGGPLLDTLLWFTDFHHFFAPVSGRLLAMHDYPGSYNYDFEDFDPFSNFEPPPPDSKSDRAGWYKQLARHKRFVWIFHTEKLGLVAMAAIGFWGVGSIVVDNKDRSTWAGGPSARNEPPPHVARGKGGDETLVVKVGDEVKQGQYLGHFGYGGSSIILAFQPEVKGRHWRFATKVDGQMAPILTADMPVQVKALQKIGQAAAEP